MNSPAVDSAAPLTVEALAHRTGVSVRNIRAYNTAGLLPPPTLQGRLGLYGDEHIRRLELVRELREQGFGLEAIRRIFERAPGSQWQDIAAVARSISGSLFAQERPVQLDPASWQARWEGRMTPELQARAEQLGLIRTLDDGRVEVLSPALGDIGRELTHLGLPLRTVLDMQASLQQHLGALAHHWMRTLADHALEHPSGPELPSLLEQAGRLATGAVQAALPVLLQRQLDQLMQGTPNTAVPEAQAQIPARRPAPRRKTAPTATARLT